MSGALDVRIVPAAERQIAEIGRWWQANRPSARGAIEEELRKAIHLLQSQPAAGVPVRNATRAGVRRLHLRRIHYYLYYWLRRDPECLEILAVWHTRRGSEPRL